MLLSKDCADWEVFNCTSSRFARNFNKIQATKKKQSTTVRGSAAYFRPNDLHPVIVAENGMQLNTKTNTAHDPQGTKKNKHDTPH